MKMISLIKSVTLVFLTEVTVGAFVPSMTKRSRFHAKAYGLAARSNVVVATNKELLSPEAISERVFLNDKRPIVLYDGVCNLCNNAVNLALDWDSRGILRYAALQSQVGRALLQKSGRSADDITSIVLITEEGAFIKSDAILKISEAVSPPWLPLGPAAVVGRVVVPKLIRDLFYDQVADNRYQLMGKRNSCRIDDGRYEDRFVKENLAYK